LEDRALVELVKVLVHICVFCENHLNCTINQINMPFSIVLTAENSDQGQLKEVKEVLESIPGLYLEYNQKKETKNHFISAPKQEGTLTEPEFFGWMSQFREDKKIQAENILVVLTSRGISNNHFNGIDFEKRNIFVDLNNWEENYLQGSPSKYPVAYHVLISILLVIYFEDLESAKNALHMIDKGCILDFNSEKKNVLLKILTARICPTCLDKFIKINDTNLLGYFRSGLEKIRHDMVEGEYYRKLKPKPMKLTFEKYPFRFDFEGVGSIKLDAAHTLVYLYFLRKKEAPVYLAEVENDVVYLDKLYREIKGGDKLDKNQKMAKVVIKLCGLKYRGDELVSDKNNALNERISHINKQLTKILGTFGLQNHFQIQNNDGRHGVSNDIDFEDNSGLLEMCEL
jgi:hypothetical protein